jgi:MFS transporter, ACS family, D-galactonate transporter
MSQETAPGVPSRYRVLALIFVLTTANDADRSGLSLTALIAAVMTLAVLAMGIGSLGRATTADLAPPRPNRYRGVTINAFSKIAGIVTPVVIGYAAQATGSIALWFVAAPRRPRADRTGDHRQAPRMQLDAT